MDKELAEGFVSLDGSKAQDEFLQQEEFAYLPALVDPALCERMRRETLLA